MRGEARTRLLAALLAAIAAVSVAGAYWAALAYQPTPASLEAPRAPGGGLHAELYVYKNGKLVYYDPDDPATDNFLYLIAELVSGDLIDSQAVAVGGYHVNYIEDTNYPGFIFLNYDPSYTFSRTQINLPSSYNATQITSGGFSVNTGDNSVTFSATFSIDQARTIYGVGVYTQLKFNDGQYDQLRYILLFYDPLETPLNVTSGDVVTVAYKIVVP